MRNMKYILHVLIFAILFSSYSCSGNSPQKKIVTEAKKEIKENEALVTFQEQMGNFINSYRIPTLVAADDVYANLKNYLVIDLRDHNSYVQGHIDGAVNVLPSDLVSYMKTKIFAGAYKKVVLVSYASQQASYAAMLLQLLGYSNAYSMKWGMSSWDSKTAAGYWLQNVSDKCGSTLTNKTFPKSPKTSLPEIKTGKTLGYDILEARAKEVLGNLDFEISADKVIGHYSDYYIVNYWKKSDYDKGHLKGAIQYDPKKSLSRDADLLTLPKDKKIVVYDYTGQHAAFVAAYLKVLGYDAYALSYGANSFMHKKLFALKIGHSFSRKEIKNYPLVKGELPSIKKEGAVAPVEEEQASAPIIRKKVKEEDEGGC